MHKVVFKQISSENGNVIVHQELKADVRDDVHRAIQTRVSLNRYDAKFMSDIWTKYLIRQRPLSEAQSELWEKIIYKYRKQLKKHGVKHQDVLLLQWKHGIYTREEMIENTIFDLVEEGGQITIRLSFPFNKQVIEELRALQHDDHGRYFKILGKFWHSYDSGVKYNFSWDNQERRWHGPFHPYLFRELYNFVKKHRLVIGTNANNVIQALDNNYGQDIFWKVKAKLVNGIIYINNISESLHDAIIANNIDLSDTSVDNLKQLFARFGVWPPDEMDEDEYAKIVAPAQETITSQ